MIVKRFETETLDTDQSYKTFYRCHGKSGKNKQERFSLPRLFCQIQCLVVWLGAYPKSGHTKVPNIAVKC
jgi:hypothetical protein